MSNHGGVLIRIQTKWSSKNGHKARSVDFKRMVMKRVAQREIIKSLDLPEERRKQALKLTRQSLRLNDALGSSRHTLPRTKAVKMLEQSREELSRMLRSYSHELDQSHLQSRAVVVQGELKDKLLQLRASNDSQVFFKPQFVQHLLQMHQVYLRLFLGESNYDRYKHHMNAVNKLIPKHD